MCSCVGFADGPLCSLISVEYICLHCHLLYCLRTAGEEWGSIVDWWYIVLSSVLLLNVDSHYSVFLSFRELKLRNYTPEDEELKERQVPKAKPASGENFSVINKLWKDKKKTWTQMILTLQCHSRASRKVIAHGQLLDKPSRIADRIICDWW